ncbi:MAG: glucose-1-phosphate thymidylyltransferase, partial [Deltaproteobacteria bacterium]|nr:glucose-1-phosphate thymidylyltransferase [Deltaproteobacteria bacterium]
LHYAVQSRPEGIAQAFVIAKEFIEGYSCCLILGDNLLYGDSLGEMLQSSIPHDHGAKIFAYWVNDPERYGVVVFDQDGEPKDIIEKPKTPVSNWAVTGLYFYDHQVYEIASSLKPSRRGEYEITDVNREYLQRGLLQVEKFGRGIAWLDTGTPESLAQATIFIQTIEQRQGLKIACLEEIAYRMGYIPREKLESLALDMSQSSYGGYLRKILGEWGEIAP